MYLPQAAVYWSRFGPLLAYWSSLGDPVRARGGPLRPRDTSLPATNPLPRPMHWDETGPILGRIGPYHPQLPVGVGPRVQEQIKNSKCDCPTCV